MAQRTWIGIASTTLGLVVTGALTTPLWAAAPEVVAQRAEPVAAAPGQTRADTRASSGEHRCDARSARPTRPSSSRSPKDAAAPAVVPTATAELQQSVSVIVPPTAIVHLGHDGHVVAAMTNTGCAPAAGDELYVSVTGGAALERVGWDTVAHHAWQGDFSLRGVLVPQSVN